MLDAALEALAATFTPFHILMLAVGVLAGLALGLLPGLGGVAGMAILLPFTYGMDPHAGIALLLGLAAANTISDTFPAVMMGIPGSSAASAVILDGYPLARRGEAGRVLGAALSSTMFGGLVGAALLLVSVPIAVPLMLTFGTPELFMLSLLGLAMVGVLSRGSALTGFLAGVVGLLVSTIGGAPGAPVFRYTFDSLYLMDGIPLTIMALGLFGFAELADLLTQGGSIAVRRGQSAAAGILRGVRDTVRNKWIVLTNSTLGVLLGIIPGMSGTVVQWIAYGFTKHTRRDSTSFGRGDIRGPIASESSVNANDGGALVPTLFFGIPASASAAMLLAGFILMGIEPGPSMLSDQQLPFVVTSIWSLALANVLGVVVCLVLSRWLVKLTVIPVTTLVPFMFVLIVMAAYQATSNWGDLVALLVFGLLGWGMKKMGWPRVPLLIGFVLGESSERYFGRSVSRYGFDWLTFPSVIVIGVLIVGLLAAGVFLQRRTRSEAHEPA